MCMCVCMCVCMYLKWYTHMHVAMHMYSVQAQDTVHVLAHAETTQIQTQSLIGTCTYTIHTSIPP